MSDTREPEDGGRATIATVAEMLRGLREFTTIRLDSIQRQLDALATLPVATAELRRDQNSLARRVDDIERDADTGSEWRRVHLPALAISLLTLLVSLSLVLTGVFK